MELKKIQYFLKIVEKGSLSKAAESLYLTQPTLSRFLAKLEEEAGTKLFLRRRDNSLSLTESGRLYLDAARKIDRIWQELEGKLAAGHRSGHEILLGIDSDSLFPFVLDCADRLSGEYPGISVQILRHEAEDAQALVAGGTLDLALTAYNKELDALAYIPIRCPEVQMIVSREHPLAARAENPAPLRLEALPPHLPFALICESTILRQVEDQYLARHSYEPQIRRTYSRHRSGLDIISGSSELIGFCPANYRSQRVVYLPLDPPFCYNTGICLRKNESQSPAVRRLTEMLQALPQAIDLDT